MAPIDWHAIFIPSVSLAEIFLRGTMIYLTLFAGLRLLPPRELGGMGVADLLVVVLIADAAQNAMSADYHSVTEGLLLVFTIFFWSYVVDCLDYYFTKLHLASSPKILLVSNGKLVHKNLAKQKMSEEDLMSQIRQYGLENLDKVKKVYLEGDGHVSVILGKTMDHRSPPRHEQV